MKKYGMMTLVSLAVGSGYLFSAAGTFIPAIATEFYLEISTLIRQELQASPEQALEILLVLTIPKDHPEGMTANLMGPVAINPQRHLAKQVLQDPVHYDACWPVFTKDPAA